MADEVLREDSLPLIPGKDFNSEKRDRAWLQVLDTYLKDHSRKPMHVFNSFTYSNTDNPAYLTALLVLHMAAYACIHESQFFTLSDEGLLDVLESNTKEILPLLSSPSIKQFAPTLNLRHFISAIIGRQDRKDLLVRVLEPEVNEKNNFNLY